MMKTFSKIFLAGLLAVSPFGLEAEMPKESYVVEDIKFPETVAPEVGGLSFTPSGKIVVGLRRHGILMATPTADPTKFDWKVFAADSMHNLCGLHAISDREIMISQMAELTKVSDTDGDGEADLYENVSDKWGLSGNYHETVTLVKDKEGSYYLAVGTASYNGPTFNRVRGAFSRIGRRGRNFSGVTQKGTVMKVDKNGKTTLWANGFRANNGIGLNKEGALFVTDNEGDWRGASPLYHVEKGDFCGHPSSLVWDKTFKADKGDPLWHDLKKLDEKRKHPAVEFQKGSMLNSPGEPLFDQTGGKFGPFTGQCFVGDIAGKRILRVMLEKVDGVYQGACVKFINNDGLRSGNNRLVFSPDGKSLYTGQTVRGWGRPSEGLQRITFKGKVPFEVLKMSLTQTGFKLTFTKKLNADTVKAVKNLTFSNYHFKYSSSYGSPRIDSKKNSVKKVTLSKDQKTLTVTLNEKITAKKIYHLDLSKDIKSKDGESVVNRTLCYKVNKLRK
jgi:glucose/arabinose dehydrogenase